MTTKWGGLWPPHLRFRPREICSDQGPSWFACGSRQPIAVPTDTTAPFNALISWKLRCSGRPSAQASTASHPSNSNGLTLPCRTALYNSKLDRNFFKFGFGRHTCRTISLGTESNLGHRVSGPKPRQPGVSARWSRYASKNGQKITQKGQLVLSVTRHIAATIYWPFRTV